MDLAILHRLKANLTVFVHIPKTGGDSIEKSLLYAGIGVGRYGFKKSFPKSRECTNRHFTTDCANLNTTKPPASFVSNSFAIVRHPIDRIVSEFCYRLGEGDKYDPTCQGLNKYIATSLYNITILGDEGLNGCHWVPQWKFTNHPFNILANFFVVHNLLYELAIVYCLKIKRLEVSLSSISAKRTTTAIGPYCLANENPFDTYKVQYGKHLPLEALDIMDYNEGGSIGTNGF
eukprot:gene9493-19726_t